MRRRDLFTGALGFTCAAVIDPRGAQTVRRKRLSYLSGGRQGTGEYILDILSTIAPSVLPASS